MENLSIVGRVTKDAELVVRNDIPVLNFNVAVNKRKATAERDEAGKRIYKQTTKYYRVTLWRDYAKAMTPHLTKGRLIGIVGDDFELETWLDSQNTVRPIVHITSPTIELLDGAKKGSDEPTVTTPVPEMTEDDVTPFD